jgi:hypothetical protein
MTEPTPAPRSRRALLAAAAGGAAALAASAALPLTTMAADPNDVVKGLVNATTQTTGIDNSTPDSIAFSGSAQGNGYGVQAMSGGGGAAVFAFSLTPPPGWEQSNGSHTGVFGWSPASSDPNVGGAGVWGASDDFGVYGTGSIGVLGSGDVGVWAESTSTSAALVAVAKSPTDLALDVRGKVKFSRAGRSTIGAGKSSISITLAGVSSGSRIFAVLHSNRPGRWVSAVVPVTGKFSIYLNTSVTSATYVAWFVIN